MSDFKNQLLAIIEERETALFEIERALFTKRYNLSRKHLEIFSVQSISMLYSIWEGFIRQALVVYLDEINSEEIEFQKFQYELIIAHIENRFPQFKSYPEKDKRKAKFYSDLIEFFSNKNQQLELKIRENNIDFDTLNKILKSLCLKTFDEHWEKYRHPNPNLKESLTSFLKYRNSVAHGGDISSEEKVTQDIYVKYKNLVTDLMYEIRLRMITAFENGDFLK